MLTITSRTLLQKLTLLSRQAFSLKNAIINAPAATQLSQRESLKQNNWLTPDPTHKVPQKRFSDRNRLIWATESTLSTKSLSFIAIVPSSAALYIYPHEGRLVNRSRPPPSLHPTQHPHPRRGSILQVVRSPLRLKTPSLMFIHNTRIIRISHEHSPAKQTQRYLHWSGTPTWCSPSYRRDLRSESLSACNFRSLCFHWRSAKCRSHWACCCWRLLHSRCRWERPIFHLKFDSSSSLLSTWPQCHCKCKCLFRVSSRTSTILSSHPCWRTHNYLLHAWFHSTIDLCDENRTIVLSFILGGESTNTVFLIAFEESFVSIPIGVDVLSFSSSLSIDVVSEILITIGVDGMSLPVVVSGRIASLSSGGSELIGSASLLFGH